MTNPKNYGGGATARLALAALLAGTGLAGTGLSTASLANDFGGWPHGLEWLHDDDDGDDHHPWRHYKPLRGPRNVVISLDGAKPDLIEKYLKTGVLPRNKGLGELRQRGVVAKQNVTATPSLTAVSHIAIATGSTAVNNDIPANSFHAVAAPIGTGVSGFAAPIGGYDIVPVGPSAAPTAEPLWVRLRKAGKSVVTATWPGADGADIKINNVSVQGAPPDETRITDFTVPFGAFGGIGAKGFELTGAGGSFAPNAAVEAELTAAGRVSFSPVLATVAPFETFWCSSTATSCSDTSSAGRDLTFEMRAAMIDTTDDGTVNYDTFVFFEKTQGIQPGPFVLPSTGPAYAKVGRRSGKFYFDGTGNKIGAAYFATYVAPDRTKVRFARYGANFIPRNAPVLDDVDDINNNVGFWAPQPDFRIPERLSPGFGPFPDIELEAMYEDQVKTFVRYQTRVALRALMKSPGADLAMIYIEQPDGSGHQFTLTDPRQASDFTNPNSIGAGQDAAKIARYDAYLKFAYQQANRAVAEIMAAVGDRGNVFVVSDHGMAPFHTAVNMTNLLKGAGIDTTKIGIRTNGPVVNIYVNLAGRESGGTVSPADYPALVQSIRDVVQNAQDTNTTFNTSLLSGKIFSAVAMRPLACVDGVGFCTSDEIGQDFGDVFAIMAEGYNFDGVQPVARFADPAYVAATSVFNVANFYGAHGHDSTLKSMSASFLAAGPAIRRGKTVSLVHNIDVAPTILHLLGVPASDTVDGRVLTEILK